MYTSRYQLGLTLLIGFFVLATLFAVLLYVFMPATPATRGPLLLAAFIAILLGALVCILLFTRWLLRPYRQLLGEAERASEQLQPRKSQDEAEFVLETFQSVVTQLQEQRKTLERLTAQASQRAQSAEKFSERIVASVPSGLVAFDDSGNSLVINGPGRELLDIENAAAGQPVTTVLRNIPLLAEVVERCLASGQIYRREEIEMLSTSGAPKRIGATIGPIDLGADNHQRGALCLLTDITEVTQLREQVVLKNNLQSLGEMSAGLAHEFKNAIATLHGYVQLLQSLELDDRARATASSLLNEVRNLSELVTSFLNFARPQPLQFDQVNLSELVAECHGELVPLFDQLRVVASVDGAPNIHILADERMLRQALLNLFRNAAEAIPSDKQKRTVDIRVDVEGAERNKWARVEVKDSGEGIPAADLHRIFIPFFTTKTAGHGVGLALAHRVVTQHNGTLSAANQSGGGAVFTMRLPVVSEPLS